MSAYRGLTFHAAIDLFVQDMRSEGRINSKHTERAYRAKLNLHGDDVGNINPRDTVRADVKATLRRWEGNTQSHGHAILSSFYRWCVEEGIRSDNPAHAVRAPRKRAARVYKMTQQEVLQLLSTADGDQRDRWLVRLGVFAGLRAQELLGVQGRHFKRAGWVWVSEGIGKGLKERWIPVLPGLREVAAEIRSEVAEYEYVIAPRRRVTNVPGVYEGFMRDRQLAYPGLHKAIVGLGERAGIGGRLTPHTLRHAFGDMIARECGLRVAQALLGHATVQTTMTYTNELSLDDLAAAVQGLDLGVFPAG